MTTKINLFTFVMIRIRRWECWPTLICFTMGGRKRINWRRNQLLPQQRNKQKSLLSLQLFLYKQKSLVKTGQKTTIAHSSAFTLQDKTQRFFFDWSNESGVRKSFWGLSLLKAEPMLWDLTKTWQRFGAFTWIFGLRLSV